MAACLIVNVAEQDYDRKLEAGHEPRFLHGTRDAAETECLRLAKLIPEGEFVIFEAVAQAVPTRTNPEVYRIEPTQL